MDEISLQTSESKTSDVVTEIPGSEEFLAQVILDVSDLEYILTIELCDFRLKEAGKSPEWAESNTHTERSDIIFSVKSW